MPDSQCNKTGHGEVRVKITSTHPLNILICDDHDVVRRGLRQLLVEAFEKVDFGEAANAREMLALLPLKKWDVVLLDIHMPGASGLDTLKELKTPAPGTPVLVVSGFPEEEFAVRSLKAGAAGFLSKTSVADEAVAAIQKVLAGGRYIGRIAAEKLVAGLSENCDRPSHESLSPREFQILRLIATGRATREIAGELSLSDKTVSTYRARIIAKTGLTSSVAMARYAYEHGLVESGAS